MSWAAIIAMLVLAVANVVAVIVNWPVSRSVSTDSLIVLSVVVFVLLCKTEPESFRPPAEGKLGFWGAMCAMAVLAVGGGVMVIVFKPQGTLMVASAVAVVAMGAGLGRFMETHLAPWYHPTTEE
jgi:hypothetical protein